MVPNDGRAAHAVSDPFFCETIEAAPEVAAVLGLQPGEKVVHVKRLLRFSGEPLVFDQIYLVADLFSGLTLEGLRGGERSLYSLFESDFGVRMIRAEEHLRAVGADAQSAGMIGVSLGSLAAKAKLNGISPNMNNNKENIRCRIGSPERMGKLTGLS